MLLVYSRIVFNPFESFAFPSKDLEYAMNWVLCCIILHNMIIQFAEQRYGPRSTQRQASEAWERAEDDLEGTGIDINDGRPGHTFHLRLMEKLLESQT